MPIRVRFMKRLLFRLLLTASLIIAPLLVWAGLPLLHVFVDEGSTSMEATEEGLGDDAEWEACPEEARLASQARFREGRRLGKALEVVERIESPRPIRFVLVLDVGGFKPKRLFVPPYWGPRVGRLLS